MSHSLAYSPAQSRGRRHAVAEHPYRNAFQRDRDRILHSASFRRLMHKTQVLLGDASDHHRTRLTHTLEVAQISRTIARVLGLNEDLTEAIALAHDLGHPPFGHAGEAVLQAALKDHGGFEHNLHGLRLVEELEERYPGYSGVNLTWEVRAAFAYHSKAADHPLAREYRLPEFPQPFLEAQLVDAADSLAYDAHDLDDALTLGLIHPADLKGVRLWSELVKSVTARHGPLPVEHLQAAVVRELVETQATDLIEATQQRLAAAGITSPTDAMRQPRLLVDFSPRLAPLRLELEQFLSERVYHHPRVLAMARQAQQCLREMFSVFSSQPDRLPPPWARRAQEAGVPRAVGDYLAGLTDRAAQEAHRCLFHQPPAP